MTLISKKGAIPRSQNRQQHPNQQPQAQASGSGTSSSSVSPENMNRASHEHRTLLYSELFQGASMWDNRNSGSVQMEPIRLVPLL